MQYCDNDWMLDCSEEEVGHRKKQADGKQQRNNQGTTKNTPANSDGASHFVHMKKHTLLPSSTDDVT